MRAPRTIGLVLVMLAGTVVTFAADTFRPSPPFTGTALPMPPRQQDAWIPPPVAALPPTLISATTTLFLQGMADPRGCEYRELEVGTGNCWRGDGGIITTHGWVLPGTPSTAQRFAVGWNGLVYPVVSVGGTADLASDIRAVIAEEKVKRTEYLKKNPGGTHYRYQHAPSEGDSLSHSTLLPGKACLLLRLGEGDLAREYWTVVLSGMPENFNNNNIHREDPYLLLATDWVWALFDRAVCAHMRGDDRMALLSAQALAPVQDAIEQEATARKYPRPSAYDDNGKEIANPPYLTFLKPLPRLLADQEGRTKSPRTTPFSLKAVTAERDQAKRIANLIDVLEEVSERQDGQPGGVTLAFDPIVKALIAEGAPAVEPLLTCLETDTRLTRSVSFGRSFHYGRTLIPVRSAVYSALAGILKTSELATSRQESPQALAARIRAYWEKNKDVSEEERWYRTLADDGATPKQWLEAAGKIVQRANVSNVPASNLVTTQPLQPGEVSPMRGEALRTKANPSVADLMRKRALQMVKKWDESEHDGYTLADAGQLALYLATWDVQAALPTLRELIRRKAAEDEYNAMPASTIARMTLERMRGNDPQAVPEYVAWVRGSKFAKPDDYAVNMLAPLWKYPHDPALAATARWLFNDPASAWSRALTTDTDLLQRSKLINSLLLSSAGFRIHVLAMLADTTAIGTVSVRADQRTVDITLKAGGQLSDQIRYSDTRVPKSNERMPIRKCDLYAMALSEVEGLPECRPYWPQAERDKAIAAIIAAFRRYGVRFDFDASLPESAYLDIYNRMQPRMSFPRFDHPATAAEVEKGTAIFALPADAEKHQVKLPMLPMKANWITLKKYPREQQSYNTETKQSTTTIAYDQAVTIWQAEELFVDGKWKRYYGAVTKHGVARIPAEEIEFVIDKPWNWGKLTNGFSCQVRPDGPPSQFTVGQPVMVTMRLCNRLGVDQRGPSVFYLPFDDGSPSLRPGMTPHLRYTADPIPEGYGRAEPQWTELPTRARNGDGWRTDEAWKSFGPGEDHVVATFDVAQLFDISKPGLYLLYFTFESANSAYDFAEGSSNHAFFQILERNDAK